MAVKPGFQFKAPGTAPESLQEFKDQYVSNMQALETALRQLSSIVDEPSHTSARLTDGAAIVAKPGDIIQITPPAAGTPVLLPNATKDTLGRLVVVMVEGTAGTVRVTAKGDLVQGVASLTLSGVGVRGFRSDGQGGWWLDRNIIALSDLAPQAAGTFVGNVTGGVVSPTAVLISTLAGQGIGQAANAFRTAAKVITSNAVGGAQNNLALGAGDGTGTDYIQFNAGSTVSGFADGYLGRHLFIMNTTGITVTLLHENALSTATNQIRCMNNADLALGSREGAHLIYDTTRWRVVATAQIASASGGLSEAYAKTIASYRSV